MTIDTNYSNNVFEQEWWLDIVAAGHWHEAAIIEESIVLARLPYVLHKKWWGTVVSMPQLTQTLGIWFKEDTENSGNAELSMQKKMITQLLQLIPKHKYLRIRVPAENRYVLPFQWLGYKIIPCFTYRISDLSDCQVIYNRFHSTVRKNIKSAKKKVSVTYETDAGLLTALTDLTFKAQSRKNPIPRPLVENIVETALKNEKGALLIARDKEGNVHAGAFFLYDKNVCYYLIAGSDPKYRSGGAQSLILWEGIQMASKHSRIFDFEGSMIEGIEQFVRRFGGECVPYYEIRKLPFLFEIYEILKPAIKKIFGYK